MLGHTRLHLGSGSNVLDGWANIDLEGGRAVIRHDLTRPLPVASGAVRFIYSEHFIEHLGHDQAKRLLAECHRVLAPHGVIRLSTPDLRKLIAEYQARRTDEWHDLAWAPSSPCHMVNEGMRLWGHQFLYDAEELEATLMQCGFRDVQRQAWRLSRFPELSGLESRPFHDEIIVEATK